MSGKVPFERISSLHERKKIFHECTTRRSEILVKTASGQYGRFQPMLQFKDGSLEGQIYEFKKIRAEGERVILLIKINQMRHFVNTVLKKTEYGWKLIMSTDFYTLNRRMAFRVSLPADLGLSLTPSHSHLHTQKFRFPMVEISSSGARVQTPANMKIKKGMQLASTIEWKKSKNLSVTIEFVHTIGNGVWGVKFISRDTATINRIRLLSVEVQQEIHFR